MEISIDKDKITQVQACIAEALNQHKFHTTEVMFGLAELIGRTIVSQTGGTIIEKMDVLRHVADHAERTIRTGWIATGGQVN